MKPYYETGLGKLYCGNVFDVLPHLDSIQTCVTSPPYWGLRDYGTDGQLGLEKTPEEYTAKMVEVFRLVKQGLRDDGTLWLNLGDSYAGSGRGADGKYGNSKLSDDSLKIKPKWSALNLKPKDLCGIPWRVAFALQADGWYLRSDIIWHKPNPMPESVTDRPTKAHEYIFLMSKNGKYYYDAGAVKEKAAYPAGPNATDKIKSPYSQNIRKFYTNTMAGGGSGIKGHSGAFKADGTPIYTDTRNKRSVWTVTTKPYSEAHFATFPPKLIEPCILAGASEKSIVLDPFFGAGTTGLVCEKLGRKWIGIEISEKYCEIAARRIENEAKQLKLWR